MGFYNMRQHSCMSFLDIKSFNHLIHFKIIHDQVKRVNLVHKVPTNGEYWDSQCTAILQLQAKRLFLYGQL